MKGNVNPFEPWRPSGIDIPPPLHASRPWRPPPKSPARALAEEPPLVEPVHPPAASKPPKAPPQPQRRQCRAQPSVLHTPVSELRPDVKVVLGMLFLLFGLGLAGVGWLGDTHWPRVFATLLAIAIGLTAGVSLTRRRAWFVRLGWMAGGLALAGLAGFFVPTTRGVNLWSAYQQRDELRALPAGDVAGYLRGAPTRKALTSVFPAFAEDIAAAEHAWFRRTADAAIEETDRQMDDDPHKALAQLHRLNTELSRLEHYALVQAELEAARHRVVQACLKVEK
jgi:hypothetical protein